MSWELQDKKLNKKKRSSKNSSIKERKNSKLNMKRCQTTKINSRKKMRKMKEH